MLKPFFLNKKYRLWTIFGTIGILLSLWYQVQVNLQVNTWFKDFYDLVQQAIQSPGTISVKDYWIQMWHFVQLVMPYIVVAVLTDFLTSHYMFRWREAIANSYMSNWDKINKIEGASQRVQEDSLKLSRMIEALGTGLITAIMTLIAFLPLLWTLSKQIPTIPLLGHVPHALVFGAIIFALIGTVGLAIVGVKLPGLEFDNQVQEAKLRKALVQGEDTDGSISPPTATALWENIKTTYYRLYFHYMYFGVAKWSYLQFSVIIPYMLLGPTIIAGAITFGTMQQTVRAFSQVESSLQYLVSNWNQIVELISVVKRLNAFERIIHG